MPSLPRRPRSSQQIEKFGGRQIGLLDEGIAESGTILENGEDVAGAVEHPDHLYSVAIVAAED